MIIILSCWNSVENPPPKKEGKGARSAKDLIEKATIHFCSKALLFSFKINNIRRSNVGQKGRRIRGYPGQHRGPQRERRVTKDVIDGLSEPKRRRSTTRMSEWLRVLSAGMNGSPADRNGSSRETGALQEEEKAKTVENGRREKRLDESTALKMQKKWRRVPKLILAKEKSIRGHPKWTMRMTSGEDGTAKDLIRGMIYHSPFIQWIQFQ